MSHTLRDVHPTFGHIPIDLVALGKRLGDPPFSTAKMLKILEEVHLGFHRLDLVQKARHCVGLRYRREAMRSVKPRTFDCSTLIQYLYAQAGIWLPRYTHLMVNYGDAVEPPYKPGDLLFTTGKSAWRHPDFSERIGHVAFVTNEETCVHTDNTETKQVIEMPISSLQWPILTARRLLPNIHDCAVVTLPKHLLWVHSPGEVEAIIRKHLQRRPRS